MRYIVFDLEWNMAGGRYEEVGRPRIARRNLNRTNHKIPSFEIFQIGAVCLDEKLNLQSSFDQKIKPQIYLELNKYVKRLTGANFNKLQAEPPFQTAIFYFYTWIWQQLSPIEQSNIYKKLNLGAMSEQILTELNKLPLIFTNLTQLPKKQTLHQANVEANQNTAKAPLMASLVNLANFQVLNQALAAADLLFCVWSCSDAPPLRSNLQYYAYPDTLPANFLDLQAIYARLSGDKPGIHSVKRAIDFLNINTEANYHDALNDAIFTAKIMQALAPILRLEAWQAAKIPLPDKYLHAANSSDFQPLFQANPALYNLNSITTGATLEVEEVATEVAADEDDEAVQGVAEVELAPATKDVAKAINTEIVDLKDNQNINSKGLLQATSAFELGTNNDHPNFQTQLEAPDAQAASTKVFANNYRPPSWLATKRTTTALMADLERRDLALGLSRSVQRQQQSAKTHQALTLTKLDYRLAKRLNCLKAEHLAAYLRNQAYDPNQAKCKRQKNAPQLLPNLARKSAPQA